MCVCVCGGGGVIEISSKNKWITITYELFRKWMVTGVEPAKRRFALRRAALSNPDIYFVCSLGGGGVGRAVVQGARVRARVARSGQEAGVSCLVSRQQLIINCTWARFSTTVL